jgi:hypothetical protein
MESAITEAFMKSVQESVDRCLAEVKEESRKFAAALNAVKHLPAASTIQSDTTHLENRITTLELAYQRQVQKTIAGLSEDIGDLDGRLSTLEKKQEPDSEAIPWSYTNSDWPGPSRKNEVVIDDATTGVSLFGSEEGEYGLVVNVNHVDNSDDVEMTKSTSPVQDKTESKEEPQKAETEEVDIDAKAEEAEEEEPESLELEEFEHEGENYYKDADNNLYKANDEGEVNETPIGRWLEKRKTIKLY